jgi:hypothetical protein
MTAVTKTFAVGYVVHYQDHPARRRRVVEITDPGMMTLEVLAPSDTYPVGRLLINCPMAHYQLVRRGDDDPNGW